MSDTERSDFQFRYFAVPVVVRSRIARREQQIKRDFVRHEKRIEGRSMAKPSEKYWPNPWERSMRFRNGRGSHTLRRPRANACRETASFGNWSRAGTLPPARMRLPEKAQPGMPHSGPSARAVSSTSRARNSACLRSNHYRCTPRTGAFRNSSWFAQPWRETMSRPCRTAHPRLQSDPRCRQSRTSWRWTGCDCSRSLWT